MSPHRVFLSHTGAMARFPQGGSFVAAAIDGVNEAGLPLCDMRYFTAADQPPAALCQQKVRECSVYVGIFGLDYGSPVREQPEVSYTELEFLTAIEQHRRGRMRVFVFLLDEQARFPGMDPLDPRQADFRRRVLNDYGLTAAPPFATPDRLRHLISHTLKEQLPPPPRADRPLQHVRYRAVNFQGRQHELEELSAALRAVRTQGTALSLVSLKGMGGVGKSALAAELAKELCREADAFPGGVLWTNLLDEDPADAARRWVHALGGDPRDLDPDDCLQRFHELAAARRVLVVLDNAQVRGPDGSEAVERLLVRSSGVTTLVTTRFRQAIPAGVPVREIDVLTPADARDLLHLRLGSLLDADPVSGESVIEGCGRLPLFLIIAGKAVANHHYTLAGYAGELRVRGLDALAADDKRAAVVFDLSWRHLSAEAREVFTMLALAPGDDVGPNLVSAWRRLSADRRGWWRWIDPRRWLGLGGRAEAKPDPHMPGRLLGELANASLLTESAGRAERYRYHDRVRDYALGKLTRPRPEVQRRFLACWTDWDMVRAEMEASGAFGLAGQYQQLRSWRLREPGDFAPWYHFIRGQAHVLAADPELFFQQAFNEPVNSPVSQAAQRRVGTGEEPERWLEWINRPQQFEPPGCVLVLTGHTHRVGSVATTPDGRTAVSGSLDKTVRVWDLQTGQCRASLQGHTSWVQSVAVTADGRTAVSGSLDKTVRVWDLQTDQCRASLQGHTDPVQSVAVTPDGRTAVSGSEDKTVRVWDLQTGQCRASLQGHTDPVQSVAVTPDGRTAVSGSKDKTVRVWDLQTGQCRATLLGHMSIVESVAVTPDGRTAVSGSVDTTVRVWDLQTGQCRATLLGHMSIVESVAVTPDGGTAVSGSVDTTMRVWDLQTGQCRATLQGHTERVVSVAVTADGRTAISGSLDKTVRVWDLQMGQCRATLQGHTRLVGSVAVAADGRTAVSGSEDKTVRVWDLQTGQCRATLQGHMSIVKSVAVTPDGGTTVSAGSWDQSVRVWDLQTGQCQATLQGHTSLVRSVAVTADGRTAVSGSQDQTVRVWDLQTSQCRATLQGHTGGVQSVAVTSDGRTAVSGSEDNTARVWDLQTSQCRAEYPADGEDARKAWAMTIQGKSHALLKVEGHFLVLRSPQTDEVTGRFPGSFSSQATSPDGRYVIAGDGRGQVYLLRLRLRSC